MVQKLFYSAFGLLMGCSALPQTGARAAHTATSCKGGVVSQDAELVRYTGCRVVAGHLDVRGVTSLAPLHSLEHVDGTLRIERTDRLYSLAGLERLRSVDMLDIRDNTALVSGGALRGLTHVRRVHVSDNPRLSKAYGMLDGLAKSNADLYLSNNSGLSTEGVQQTETFTGVLAAR
jgi:hypothetical protein